MKTTAICGLFMLLNFVAFAQIPSDANLHIQLTVQLKTNAPGVYISGMVSNTQADIFYEVQYKQNRTNWTSLGFFPGSEITNCQPFGTWIPATNGFDRRAFRIRSWLDSYKVGIPDWWQIKHFGNIGIDGDDNPMHDGWNNLEKYGHEMDPFKCYPPPEPEVRLSFQKGSDLEHEDAILVWICNRGTIPDFFKIERANRIWHIDPSSLHLQRYIACYTSDGKFITNRPVPPLRVIYNRPELMSTGAYQTIVQLSGQPTTRNYRYVNTNVFALPEPDYRVSSHYGKLPPFAKLGEEATKSAVKKTILSVIATPQTNGYELTVLHPIVHARYLLLVRDQNDRQWRASGYFVSGTNQNPVCLHADKKGMMTDKQSPIKLPEVKCLADVVQPEFTAGWGEDSDGDGLPDVYEVLVTHTKPDDADTGDTGIPDGYRVFANDGWNNWQKFLYRANPFKKYEPPPAIVLRKPTQSKMIKAQAPTTDLPYNIKIEIQTNGASDFQPYSLSVDSYLPRDQYNPARGDVRISWKVPPPNP